MKNLLFDILLQSAIDKLYVAGQKINTEDLVEAMYNCLKEKDNDLIYNNQEEIKKVFEKYIEENLT